MWIKRIIIIIASACALGFALFYFGIVSPADMLDAAYEITGTAGSNTYTFYEGDVTGMKYDDIDHAVFIEAEGTQIRNYMTSDKVKELVYVLSESDFTPDYTGAVPEENCAYKIECYDIDSTNIYDLYIYEEEALLADYENSTCYFVSGTKFDKYMAYLCEETL